MVSFTAPRSRPRLVERIIASAAIPGLKAMASSFATARLLALFLATLSSGCIVPPATHKLSLPDVVARVSVERVAGGEILVVGPEMQEEFGLPAGHSESGQLRSTLQGSAWRHALRLSFLDVAANPRSYSVASVYNNAAAVPVVVLNSHSQCSANRCTQQLVVEIPLSAEQMQLGSKHGIALKLMGAGQASNHFMPPSYVGGQLRAIERLLAAPAKD